MNYELQKIKENDVFTFEVYPTSEVISAGTIDADTGLAYAEDVPANDTAYFQIYVPEFINQSKDIYIDWGDGIITRIDGSQTGTIEFEHTYASEFLDKKHIVTIFGSTYNRFRGYHNSKDDAEKNHLKSNIISKIFSDGLLVPQCLINVSSCCRYNRRIQKIDMGWQYDIKNINTVTSAFSYCTNLIEVNVAPTAKINYTHMYSLSHLFAYCTNLKISSLRMTPRAITSGGTYETYNSVYRDCVSLESDIISLIPVDGFISKRANMSNTFENCKKITCSNLGLLASFLWNDTSRIFEGTRTTFNGSNILTQYGNQIPTTWGGSKV